MASRCCGDSTQNERPHALGESLHPGFDSALGCGLDRGEMTSSTVRLSASYDLLATAVFALPFTAPALLADSQPFSRAWISRVRRPMPPPPSR
jgi:hypothetical protein